MNEFRYIVADAAKIFNTTPEKMLGGKRSMPEVQARQAVMYALSKLGHGPSRIAEKMGCHHSTVIHGCRAAQDRLDVGTQFAEETAQLTRLWGTAIQRFATAPDANEIFITVNAPA